MASRDVGRSETRRRTIAVRFHGVAGLCRSMGEA
jgi:hypothetical protein